MLLYKYDNYTLKSFPMKLCHFHERYMGHKAIILLTHFFPV